MPTSNKTTNLKLNSWLSTDKPKREDFVNDNNIIDEILGAHIANSVMHLSASDRENLKDIFYFDVFDGTGAATYAVTLDIAPKLVFVYLRSNPLISYDTTHSCTVCNSGIAVQGYSTTSGLTLANNRLIVQQSQSYPGNGGVYLNLNSSSGTYTCVALK